MSELIEKARTYRAKIEEMASSLDEETAVAYPDFFPQWREDATYAVDDKVCRNGTLYRVIQAHTAQPDWAPEDAASLFAEVLPGQEESPIGEWVQPDSTNPYMTGDRVIFEGLTYESLIDNNVWSPSDYPAGWQEVTE